MLYNRIKIFFLIAVGVLTQMCTSNSNNKNKGNPYEDDYTKISTLKNRDKWNGANVHDPTCIKVGDTYYLYSTDAYYIAPNMNFKDDPSVKMGHTPIRSSKDLVHWKFEGWVFEDFPEEALTHVKETNQGNSPDGIWAPYIHQKGDEFRLYYSLSYFGSNGSFIGMATSKSPLGPWKDMGEVVKTFRDSEMNAIDPTVLSDPHTGKEWMIYGSYFGGLFCMELDPETGLAKTKGDQGVVVARRADGKSRVIEAPEIVYNKEQDMYYLFVSYDSLFTYYNVRVGRSKSPTGPFLDYFGNDMRDTTNNYPILTYTYKFNNQPGWAGNAHCAVIEDKGKYYAFHQGRLAPVNLMLQLQCREVKWLKDGWPVFSPERYNISDEKSAFTHSDLDGSWEVIELKDLLELADQGEIQIPVGEWKYTPKAFNSSKEMIVTDGKVMFDNDNYKITGVKVNGDSMMFTDKDGVKVECKLFSGWDWENENKTILFSGILPNGHGFWGKKIVKQEM